MQQRGVPNTIMKNFRYGHCKDIFVKVGDTIKKGQKIATVGTGNGQWSAHLHFDLKDEAFTSPIGYVFGWTKEEVEQTFPDPTEYIKTVFPEFDHYGWKYLELADYSGKKCYHPGVDLNGPGAGNADFGDPIYSACDGKVVYCYDGAEHNGGWGKLLIIEEIKVEPKQDEVVSIPVKVETPPEMIIDFDKASGQIITAPTYQDLADPKNQLKDLIDSFKYLINLIIKQLWKR